MMMLLLFVSLLLLVVVVDATIDVVDHYHNDNDDTTIPLVRVYDNVLTSDTADWLHKECTLWNNDDVVFVFPLKHPEQHTAIVRFLNQLLHQLYPNASAFSSDDDENHDNHDDDDNNNNNGNGSPMFYVEFWKRPKWYHILAHADMDEGWEKQLHEDEHEHKDENRHASSLGYPFKHPETGHVLYLKVGTKVQGPTVVWNVTQGGNFFEEHNHMHHQRQYESSEMIVVPAVEGRLLKFRGDLLHGVPRPANVFWTHDWYHEERHEPIEDFQRSVLLFNTWRIDKGKLIDYDVLNGTTAATSTTTNKHNIPTQQPQCNPKERWNEVLVNPYHEPAPATTTTSTTTTTTTSSFWSFLTTTTSATTKSPPPSSFQVPLMGDERRRGMEGQMAHLQAPKGTSRMMKETSKVTSVVVEPYKPPPWFSFMGIEF